MSPSHGATPVDEKTSDPAACEPVLATVPARRSGSDAALSEKGSGDTADVLVVDWDGPDDPENPRNWELGRKWAVTLVVSGFLFISPVSSAMISPATDQLVSQFHIGSSVVAAMTTSSFLLAYAVGPLFLGPLSEVYGRVIVLQLSNLWYLAWNLACAFAQSSPQLIAFRFLAGIGGSAPLSIGGAVIGDCFNPDQRGKAIAVYGFAPLFGPFIGPLTGAWVAEKSDWRWVFYSTTIATVGVQVLGFLFLRETYAPVLLKRKLKRIAKNMGLEGAGACKLRTRYEGDSPESWRAFLSKSLLRPFVFFVREPIVQLLGIYFAFMYGLTYLFVTTISPIFLTVYGEPVGISGLHYLSQGLGVTLMAQVNGRTMDAAYAWLKRRAGGEGRPEFRLPPMMLGTILLPVGILIAGWCAETRQPWIAVDIGFFVFGMGTVLTSQCVTMYVVDTFTLHAASALAAVTFLCSMAGFGFPLFAPAMYAALGYGKGNTLIAVVGIALGCPAPWLFWFYGERIRRRSLYAVHGAGH
ncbi:MFS polyamine transporter [Phanerochaete sordida]|uniref:MFS polyamine transporter n=1 Tax=Phanerochaete sordida TaxID=48140 RepID=A0A9P3GCY4_9APHY|nr:MFS polyamine transporter [Phanerochaete sordida]